MLTNWIDKYINLILDRNPNKIIKIASGFGPSGKPHIGTLVEQLRVEQIVQKLLKTGYQRHSQCFVDNLDGLRKIPPNFKEITDDFLDIPVCDIPYKNSNLAEINANQLAEQMKIWKINNEIVYASDFYKTQEYYNIAILILKNYHKILDIILPTLSNERKQAYSPFMPICNITGKILKDAVKEYGSGEPGHEYIKYINTNQELITLDLKKDRYKLQWHVNFAARWMACNTDFEMYGKDLIPSAKIAVSICTALGYKPPILMVYELFLNDYGAKMSKSSGNYKLDPELWKEIAPIGSLEYFAFQNPHRAKKLTLEKVIDYVEEYLNKTDFYIFHSIKTNLSFRMLVQLARLTKHDPQLVEKFVQRYHVNKIFTEEEILLIKQACKYAEITYNKQTINMTNDLKLAIAELANEIEQEQNCENLQKIAYTVGNKYFGEENLVTWFANLYILLLGVSSGPRIGTFFAYLGIKETVNRLRNLIN